MNELKEYLKRYSKDPLTLTIDIHNIRNGLYHINGEVSAENWLKVCKTANIKPLGNVCIDIDMEKHSFKLHLTGKITAEVEMECIRTLKPLKKHLDITFEEEIFTSAPREGEEFDEILKDESFNVADFIKQIIQLNIEPYPVHESTVGVPQGDFGLSDGLDEEVKKEKNPFSVLKTLK